MNDPDLEQLVTHVLHGLVDGLVGLNDRVAEHAVARHRDTLAQHPELRELAARACEGATATDAFARRRFQVTGSEIVARILQLAVELEQSG